MRSLHSLRVHSTLGPLLASLAILLAGCGGDGGSGTSNSTGTDASDQTVAIQTAIQLDNGAYLESAAIAIDPTGSHGPVGHLWVRLDADPGAAVTVDIAHDGGDADQIIYLGRGTFATTHSLDFDSGNWDQWQQVTLSALSDSDGLSAADYALSAAGLASARVTSLIALTADTTITGTIVRSDFVAAKPGWEAHDDIAFTLSWIKLGSGADARYIGSYTDNDPLNVAPADAHGTGASGNDGRHDFSYPAYGFIHNDDFHVIVAKPVLTPRSTVEENLLVLVFDDDSTTSSGSGLLTATDLSRATGTYPISLSATPAASPGALLALLPLAATGEYPIDSVPLQLSQYGGAGGLAVVGNWQLAVADYLYTGDSFDADANDDGDLHGLVVGSPQGLGIPNLLGVRASSDGLHIYGLPFYSEPDTSFPFGALGGRYVDLADGTSDRAFLFLSFPAN